jgi:hypothetical protein
MLPVLERNKVVFEDIAKLEKLLECNQEICYQLNFQCDADNILAAVREARMCYYDNEVLKIKERIGNAEIAESD